MANNRSPHGRLTWEDHFTPMGLGKFTEWVLNSHDTKWVFSNNHNSRRPYDRPTWDDVDDFTQTELDQLYELAKKVGRVEYMEPVRMDTHGWRPQGWCGVRVRFFSTSHATALCDAYTKYTNPDLELFLNESGPQKLEVIVSHTIWRTGLKKAHAALC